MALTRGISARRKTKEVLVKEKAVRTVSLLGPAFIAAVAYVDPGNVATNITAGAEHGYLLVWVIVAANIVACLVQYLSAKLGLVTGKSLAKHLGESLPGKWRYPYWAQAELISMATDLAEVIGGALALYLLFGVPLPLGAVITAAVALVVLYVGDKRGQHALEKLIAFLLGMVALGFLAGVFVGPPDGASVAGGLVPGFDGAGSILLASGIVGATVMPHVIYLHSSLTVERKAHVTLLQRIRATRLDILLALSIAGLINLGLLLLAAANLQGIAGTDTLEGVHEALASELGAGIALIFAVGLFSSGLASTAVGGAAGAEIMGSMLNFRIPVLLRRTITVIPAVAMLALSVDPTKALVVSQVILSLGIPFALIPLILFTARRSVMGEWVNRRATTAAAILIAALVVSLNVTLVGLTFFGE